MFFFFLMLCHFPEGEMSHLELKSLREYVFMHACVPEPAL